jgi:Asp-tRNA(Asn)/Glu-tRNA(Gln) amidotransferase C subunit
LLDRLQLPESERASLAAEENEIAELHRKLEEADVKYSDIMYDNEELRQEIRDLQLEMEGTLAIGLDQSTKSMYMLY